MLRNKKINYYKYTVKYKLSSIKYVFHWWYLNDTFDIHIITILKPKI